MMQTDLSAAVITRSIENDDLPQIDLLEVWRYAGYRGTPPASDSPLYEQLQQLLTELPEMLNCRVCYRELPLREGKLPFQHPSENVSALLEGCERMVVFAVTLGLEIDRRILRSERISPIKALLLQALGAERAEALAEHLCHLLTAQYEQAGLRTTRRFSPGYGDWPLSVQTEIMSCLQCQKNIGVTLGESLLMTPTKSITAVFGVRKDAIL